MRTLPTPHRTAAHMHKNLVFLNTSEALQACDPTRVGVGAGSIPPRGRPHLSHVLPIPRDRATAESVSPTLATSLSCLGLRPGPLGVRDSS